MNSTSTRKWWKSKERGRKREFSLYNFMQTWATKQTKSWFSGWNPGKYYHKSGEVSEILTSIIILKILTMVVNEINDLWTTWMHKPSKGDISFFRLSLIIPYIFSRNAVSCCLNSNAGYLASTCLKSSSLRKPRPLRKESPGLWGEARRP